MASNYMTSDGVDLDSRYLGINAKAKSAATADTANSVAWGSVSGKPSFWPKINWNSAVKLSGASNWTAPSNGVLFLQTYSSDNAQIYIGTGDKRVRFIYVDNTVSHDNSIGVIVKTVATVPILLSKGDVVGTPATGSIGSSDGFNGYFFSAA